MHRMLRTQLIIFANKPMEVCTTPCEATAASTECWEPYDDEEYDSSSSEFEYFPLYNDGLIWHQEYNENSEEDWERIGYFEMQKCSMDTCCNDPSIR